MKQPVSTPIEALRAARTRFGPRGRAAKLDLLSKLAQQKLSRARDLRDYHDILLFLIAHPDDAHVSRLAESELQRLGARVAELSGRALLNSGLPGSMVESPFTLDTTAWLARRYPDDVDLVWEDESAGTALDELLGLCVGSVEQDGLLDGRLSTREWLAAAKGNGRLSELQWLLQRIQVLDTPPALLDYVFNSLDLSVRFRLPREAPRLPTRHLHYQTADLQRSVDVDAALQRALPVARPLPAREANRLIDVARMALCALRRETDPVTYANPREVTRISLDRGIDIVLYGMQPARRLPLESFFGYLAAKNGVPVAYGGGWVFLDRSEIGINVFPPFRGGESAYLFAEILRVYHRHYGVRRFLVDPFQFGDGNREGIRSGAFWFYYRLGFRPVEPALAELAAREWAAISRSRSHRSPPTTLRRLATGKLALEVGEPVAEAPDPVALGLAVTRAVGERFGGDRAAAERWARRRIGRLCPAGRAAPAEQQDAADRLAMLYALIPDVDDWPVADRRRMMSVMRAKGALRERDYVTRLQGHRRLRAALSALGTEQRTAG